MMPQPNDGAAGRRLDGRLPAPTIGVGLTGLPPERTMGVAKREALMCVTPVLRFRPPRSGPALLALGLLLGPASAHERPLVQQTQMPGHNPLDCYCRAQGRIFAPGETICMRVGGRGQLAECRMEINVMSWSPTDRPCPES